MKKKMKISILIPFFCCLLNISVWAQYESNAFKIPTEKMKRAAIQSELFVKDVSQILDVEDSIYGLSVSGHVFLKDSTNSLVRVTVEDSYGREYLVYEVFPLLADVLDFNVDGVAMESVVLDGIKVKKLNIDLINAEFRLDDAQYVIEPVDNLQMVKRQNVATQENYIVNKLNDHLQARNIPWVAGSTAVSDLAYEEKKAMFGGKVPNLSGFEYYVGGVFIMPGYQVKTDRSSSPYIKEWDWRDRHGKYWSTPAQSQGLCNSCWAYAAIGALESYVRLYYNQSEMDIDLSEQELISCTYKGTDMEGMVCSAGGNALNGFWFVQQQGVVPESCFPSVSDVTGEDGDCDDKCSSPSDWIKIDNPMSYYAADYTEDDLKKKLFRAPAIIYLYAPGGVWRHEMLVLGYKEMSVGFQYLDRWGNPQNIGVGNPFIGTAAWLVKNSWGRNWGMHGFGYVAGEWGYNVRHFVTIEGDVSSIQYDDKDVLVTDEDGDGYYVWGLGSRPTTVPSWAPAQQDGDDSDSDLGPLNEYGYCMDLNPETNDPIYIRTSTNWNTRRHVHSMVYVQPGGVLRITNQITMHEKAKILVADGGKLIVDGGLVERADVKVFSGGSLELQNGGILRMEGSDVFESEPGAVMLLEEGSIE